MIALEAIGIDKHFAGTPALVGAHLRVRPGTVHALLGGNGSGKSTLIKVLAGVHSGDAGVIRVLGTHWAAPDGTARVARAAGLRFVHQDLGLFDSMTIAENVAFDTGFPTRVGGSVQWGPLRRRVAALLDRYEIDASPRTTVGELRPSQRTMVAVARALQDQEGSEFVLCLDEPTASLPNHESRLLLQGLRRRAEGGQTIVFVTHHLGEVLDVADDVTVLRDGKVAAAIVDRTPTEDELVELIAGRSVDRRRQGSSAGTEAVLTVRDLHVGPLRGLDLNVHRGEVVGLAGLVGSGRTTALTTIFGARKPTAGAMTLGGAAYRPGSPGQAMAQGAALVPEDRLGDGSFGQLSVSENASMSVLGQYWRAWLRRRAERRDTQALLTEYAVKSPGPDAPLLALSGGNQQKVVLARSLRRAPVLLLLDEPTQGVDVASRSDIYAQVRRNAAAGCAVLIASSDFEELGLLCDRVLILRAGRICAELEGHLATADLLTRLVQSSGPSQEVAA